MKSNRKGKKERIEGQKKNNAGANNSPWSQDRIDRVVYPRSQRRPDCHQSDSLREQPKGLEKTRMARRAY